VLVVLVVPLSLAPSRLPTCVLSGEVGGHCHTTARSPSQYRVLTSCTKEACLKWPGGSFTWPSQRYPAKLTYPTHPEPVSPETTPCLPTLTQVQGTRSNQHFFFRAACERACSSRRRWGACVPFPLTWHVFKRVYTLNYRPGLRLLMT